jgi:hypothetical protein
MYKSGQIVFDKKLQEPVIFVEGNGEVCTVVCTGVEDTDCLSDTSDLIPLWNKNDKVFTGKLAVKNFATIVEVDKTNYEKYCNYIEEIMTKVSFDGKNKEQQYHTKG